MTAMNFIVQHLVLEVNWLKLTILSHQYNKGYWVKVMEYDLHIRKIKSHTAFVYTLKNVMVIILITVL